MLKIDESAAKLDERLAADLGEIELKTMQYSLADAIREGASVTEHAVGCYGDGANACALTAAVVSARHRKYL